MGSGACRGLGCLPGSAGIPPTALHRENCYEGKEAFACPRAAGLHPLDLSLGLLRREPCLPVPLVKLGTVHLTAVLSISLL